MPGQPLPLAPEDFYMEGDTLVFTEAYHLKRGDCCGSRCRHCPYRAEDMGTARNGRPSEEE